MMGIMSSNAKTSLRRAALVAAPLAVAALALSACSPDHITTMDSPTPQGSNLATPYSAAPSSSAPAESPAADASSLFSAKAAVDYTVSSVTVDGTSLDLGAFSDVSIFGDASGADGAQLTTIGLCDGSVYTVTGKGTSVTSTAGDSWSTDKCGTPEGEAVATKVHSVLEGKLSVAATADGFSLTGDKGEIVLTPAA